MKLEQIPNATFDRKGTINASDSGDLMVQLVKYAQQIAISQQMAHMASEQEPMSATLTAEEQARIISGLDVSSQRLALGQAMANPIRQYLDYRGVMRRSMKVDPLAQGAIPIYDRDVEGVQAVTIAANGAAPESKIYGSRFQVPILELVANPTVKIREVKTRRFNLIDRIQVKTRQFLQEAEDDLIISVLRTAGIVDNAEQVTAAANVMRKDDVIELCRMVEQWDLVAASMFMSIYRFADFRKWDRSEVDPVTQKAILDTGLFAKLWNAAIYVTKRMSRLEVLCTAEPEFVGVIPVYQDIEVMPADEPRQTLIGWVMSELFGVFCTNTKGVARLRVKTV
jgi:hypothetical protein